MNKQFRISNLVLSIYILLSFCAQKTSQLKEPIRYTLNYCDAEREYFVWLPQDYEQDKIYWPLVVVHGGGGDGLTFWLTEPLRRTADELGLNAIIISPTFDKSDPVAQRYPAGNEGRFLKKVLEHIRKDYQLKPKMLLTGYSRGAQFAHRYALWNPEQVKACAPLAAGAWTTPDGRLFDYSVGEVKEPEQILKSKHASEKALQRLQDPRVAEFGTRQAAKGAQKIPFMVMCGSLDIRFGITQEFVASLRREGYQVETEWPRTHHGGRAEDEYKAEFEKYSRSVAGFFGRVTDAN